MKKNQLDEWNDFCLMKKEFDSCYFQTLFHADPLLTKQQLKIIFQYFPNSDLLIHQMVSLFDVLFVEKRNYALENTEIKYFVIQDIEEKLRLCYKYSEDDELPSKNILSFPLNISDDLNLFKNKKKQHNISTDLFDYTGDTLDNLLIRDDKLTDALLEAFYGLTHDFTLQWYAATPLYSKFLDFGAYYKIWKANVDYVVTNDEILVYKPKAK